MGNLTRFIANESQIGYGVNVIEQQAPPSVEGASTNVVGLAGAFPWGEPGVVLSFGSGVEALATLAPPELASSIDTTTWPALLALTLAWPGPLRVVRVVADDAAEASLALAPSGAGQMVATAVRSGEAGNEITVQITAATSGSGSHRNVVVAIGSAYRAVYENLDGAGVAAIEDPWVSFAGALLPNVAAAAALSGGDNGTLAAGDYGAAMVLFGAEDADAAILCCPGAPSALADDLNAAAETWLGTVERPVMVVGATEAGLTASEAATAVSTLDSDRLVYAWPRITVLDAFASNPTTITIDPAADVACAMASSLPERSPGGASGAPFLRRITGVELGGLSKSTLDGLKDDGVAVLFISQTLGPIIRGAVTTSKTALLAPIYRRRMSDFINESIAALLEQYAEMPLDMTLSGSSKSLGTVTSAEVGAIQTFLEELRAAGRIAGYIVDPYTLNNAGTVASNRFYIQIRVSLNGAQEEIVLKSTIGPGLILTSEG